MSATTTRCGWTLDRTQVCRPARVARAAPSTTVGVAASLSGCGCPDCPGALWRSDHVLESAPRHAAVAHRTVRRDGQLHAPNPANHHASQPSRSRIAFRYSQALRPVAVDDGLWDSTLASASGAAQSPLRLAGTRRPPGAAPTATAGPPTLHRATQDQAADRRSVEARATPRPLRAPPPSGVFYPPSLFGRLALHGPRRSFAHVAQSMQMDAHGFDACCMASDTVQVDGQQPSRPHRAGHIDRVWVQVDHAFQLCQPRRRYWERS